MPKTEALKKVQTQQSKRKQDLDRADKALAKITKAVNKLKDEQARVLGSMESNARARREELAREIALIENELITLEERKRKALEPVDALIVKNNEIRADLKVQSKDLSKRAKKADATTEKYQNKLVRLDNRELNLKEDRKTLSSNQKVLKREQKELKEASDRLDGKKIHFQAHRAFQFADIERQRKGVDKQTRQNASDLKKIAKELAGVEKTRKHVLSQSQSLNAAFKLARKKGIKI
tara:strand:- start:1538 stop:2248 length:711 start_codon:yes stop_codon:yes gene_type:complete